MLSRCMLSRVLVLEHSRGDRGSLRHIFRGRSNIRNFQKNFRAVSGNAVSRVSMKATGQKQCQKSGFVI